MTATSELVQGAAAPFVVVSGLPASGKTTLARKLAAPLHLPLLDKDTILVAMFKSLGIADTDWRQRLSRASDEILEAVARESRGAVLTSFWRHPSAGGDSGTPTDWLGDLSPSAVEVHCVCPVETAVARFQNRNRHPGHHDAARPAERLRQQFTEIAALGPLGIGSVVQVDTSQAYDLKAIIAAIRGASA